MATKKTTAGTTTAAAPRKRTTKAKAAESPVIEVPLSPEEAEAKLREQIAVLAYLLWESGAPGDPSEHWLQAERQLRSA